MLLVKSKMSMLIFIIKIFFFSFLTIPSFNGNAEILPEFKNMINSHQKYENIEEEVFKKLVFKLSSFQLEDNNYANTLRLILEDQLNRRWLFKFGRNASDGAIAIYRIFSLFGLDTPEIHYKELNINGEILPGTIQRFIPNLGTLAKFLKEDKNLTLNRATANNPHANWPTADIDFKIFPSHALDYLVKMHIMSWLTTCHHIHPSQFLVIGENKKPEKIMKIDNAIEWFLLGQDELSETYQTPLLHAEIGYVKLWSPFKRKKINLQLAENYLFVNFISQFPDEYFLKFFQEGIKNEFKYFSNLSLDLSTVFSRGALVKADKNNFIINLQKRKKNAPDDFMKFYSKLCKARNENCIFNSKKDYKQIFEEIISFHNNKIELHQKELEQLKVSSQEQQKIDAQISNKGFNLLAETFRYMQVNFLRMNMKLKADMHAYDELINQCTNEHELMALKRGKLRLNEFYNDYVKFTVTMRNFGFLMNNAFLFEDKPVKN